MGEIPTFDESAAELLLCGLKWGDDAIPTCPKCGSRRSYQLRKRHAFKCRRCRAHYRLLSNTPFENAKVPYSVIVRALIMYQDSDGNVSAAEMSRGLGISYKAAFVMKRKCWEACMSPNGLLSERSSPLSRGYWQGFNMFFVEDGQLWRENKFGEKKLAT